MQSNFGLFCKSICICRRPLCYIRDKITSRVSNDDNYGLARLFSCEEIKESILQMLLDKSPSPNGFNLGFHHFYNIYGDVFMAGCKWLKDDVFSLLLMIPPFL